MVGLGSLTAEQHRIIALPARDNQLIVGPAGSGKTVLLLHRANYLLRNLQVAPHLLRVLVYTNVLENYIRSGSESLGLPLSTVQSFYSWVFELARERRIRFARDGTLAKHCRNALSAVLEYFEKNHVSPALEAALVDEGQDLPPEAYRLLARAACHVTVCADYEQCLYEHSTDISDALTILGIRTGPVALTYNLRSAAPITKLAECFLSEPERQRNRVTSQETTLSATVRFPLLLRCSSSGQQWQRVAAILKHEIARNARIGVLLPGNDLVDEAYSQLRKQGLPVEKIVAARTAYADFDELTPKVLTIFSAKGLSFDSVLVPCITEEHYSRRPIPPEKLLFVACSRALDWACLSTVVGQEPKILLRVRELTAAGHLVEQNAEAYTSSTISLEPVPNEEVPL